MKKQELIIFDWPNVSLEKTEKEYDSLVEAYRAEVARLIAKTEPCAYQDFARLEEFSDQMQKLWSPIINLKMVVESRIDKEIFARLEEKESAFSTEILQNEEWYRVCKTFYESDGYQQLTAEQKMAQDLKMRDFRLNGVSLPADKKARFKEIELRLTVLGTKFRENIFAAVSPKAWSKLITEEGELKGLPDWLKKSARQNAVEQGKEGFLFFLGEATYGAVMDNAKSRTLRREFHEAWYTRASDAGPNAGKWDNTPLIKEISAVCHEEAQLVGFKNYAEYQLATRMATSEQEVMDFQNNILSKVREPLVKEMAELSEYALRKDGVKKLEEWDVGYYFERVKEEKYSFSQEEVREYFPLPQALAGVFAIANRLYGVSFKERVGVPLWHPDAKFFEMSDAAGKVIGGIYMDLYERAEGKMSGAWMKEAVFRRALPDSSIQLPVGYLNCNFSPPETGKPALLTAYEVGDVLLHEFGHNLQHLLTECTVLAVSGMNGVPQDGIELASQLMENFFWTDEGVKLLSAHYQTGKPLPDELFQKMKKARNFGRAYLAAWYLWRGIADFRLYAEYNPRATISANELFREVHEDIFPMLELPEYSRMPCNFSHIFADEYAAGYYSYDWAKNLAAFAFELFLKGGKIDWSEGKKLQAEVLSRGGSRPFMESCIAFGGRKPSEDALLRQLGFI
jgi:oligopeptidase A